ncbi:MAG: prolipoprotein diacylglyceryl transferase [Chloroflexi bacterium]|nr:prolipoprotein diacylglyceryl transferase [Chloroflexota bacterium]
MLPELGRIGPLTLRTYTVLLDTAIITGLVLMFVQARRFSGEQPAHWVDAGLGALLLGIVAGRLGHVGIYWHYFTDHRSEIIQVWLGGIDWHTAVIGGVAGLLIVSAWRGISFARLSDAAALTLPIGVILTYLGCLSTSCGHGREVGSLADYPPLVAAELSDLYGVVAPRLSSQLYGAVLGVVLLLVFFLVARCVQREGIRLWVLLILLGLGAFGIGFTRGDSIPMVGGLRLDQLLDLSISALAFIGLLAALQTPVQET